MDNCLEGRVLKSLAGKYWVSNDEKTYVCSARGKLRQREGIFVGDKVVFVVSKDSQVIQDVLPRKNALVRPPVSNIDCVLIIVAKEPIPDLLLVDKILINSYSQNIDPIVCYNKTDLASRDEVEAILSVYRPFLPTIAVSAENEMGFSLLEEMVTGKFVCLAGQSAVGKTSILNAILGIDLKTGELSRKINRGRNTTRHVEVHHALNAEIVDTCGFSMLENIKIHESELAYYYPDFLEYSGECKFNGCAHISEPGCMVKKMLINGKIDASRYERYLKIYNEIKETRETEYQ